MPKSHNVRNHIGVRNGYSSYQGPEYSIESRLTVAAIHALGLFLPVCQLVVWTLPMFWAMGGIQELLLLPFTANSAVIVYEPILV